MSTLRNIRGLVDLVDGNDDARFLLFSIEKRANNSRAMSIANIKRTLNMDDRGAIDLCRLFVATGYAEMRNGKLAWKYSHREVLTAYLEHITMPKAA